MSVAGIDIGDLGSCVAVARKRGVDVLLNKESKRETPTCVSFGTKARQLGTDAIGSLSVNPRNTVFGLKRLLGKNFQDPEVQADIGRWPFTVVEGADGGCLVEVDYFGEKQQFTPEQLVAMMIVDMKDIAKADGSPVTDCVISVPTFFTEKERYAMLNAAEIAQVNCLRLINDTTATALAYGIYKTDLPEKDAVNVVFVDVGLDALQVSIVAFRKGQLSVLSHAWDRNLGGRDFDEALFEHFVKEFNAKYKLDIKSNRRASLRLRVACEKLKKFLSSIPDAQLNVESLMDDIDVSSSMTRDTFNQLAEPVLQRVRAPLLQALTEAKLDAKDISAVEVVGGSSRIPAILETIQEVFGKVPSRTLNAKEVVSRGCALNCAMLSPIFRVKEFEVIDIFPFGVNFTWTKDGEETTSTLFERGGAIPSAKMLTFYRDTGFDLTADYTPDSPIPASFDKRVGVWEIAKPTKVKEEGKPKLKVKVRLNLHGIVAVESVVQVEEEEYEETVKKAPSAPAKVVKEEAMPDAPPSAGEDVKMEDATGGAGAEAPAPAADGGEGTAEPSADGAAPMETDSKEGPKEETEVVKKTRVKKIPIGVTAKVGGLDQQQLQAYQEKELDMELQAKLQEETNERKNALEAYIYSLRNKLSAEYEQYITVSDKEALHNRLMQMEDWLYDEGEDVAKSVYIEKLEELKKLGSAVELRYREAETRPTAAESLRATVHAFLTAAQGAEAKYSHIAQEDKDKIAEEATKALNWLSEKVALQEQALKSDEPVLLTADILKKEDTLRRFAEPILSTPPPPSPKENPPPVDAKEDAPAPEPEPMDSEPSADTTGPEPMVHEVD